MAKKTEEVEEAPKVAHTSADFGREDINALARKVNELVDIINAL